MLLGLAITRLLQGIGRTIQSRDRVEMFWPPIAWAGLLVLASAPTWWALFGLPFSSATDAWDISAAAPV